MRIGLAVVATGKYRSFVKPLFDSAREHFMRGHDVEYLLIGDGHPSPTPEPTHIFYVDNEPWPGPTIHRHGWVYVASVLLKNCDYVFMCDADMRFVAPVGDEILGDLVGTIHPGFWNKPRSAYSYEHRFESAACIPKGAGERYYAGGFQGGKVATYLGAVRTIAERIATDEANGVTAVWHDESHWNRYLFEHPPTVELDPGYCYPESLTLPFTPRLLALDKDHSAMRS